MADRISDQYPRAAQIIRHYESVNQSGQPHLIPYEDIGGTWVAGYGRTVDKDRKEIPWTIEQSEVDLDTQISEKLKEIDQLERELPEGLTFTKSEKEALIPFLQNVGYTKLKGTRAMEALKRGDKRRFAFELFDAEKGFTKGTDKEGRTTVLGGLVERRGREGSLFYEERNIGGMVSRNPYPHNPRSI